MDEGNIPVDGQIGPSAHASFALCIVFLILTSIFVALRLWARKLSNRPMLVADWLIVFAQFMYICYITALLIGLLHGGLGWHQQYVSLRQSYFALGADLTNQLTYALAMTSLKISVCLLYITMFPQRWVRVAAYVLIVFTFLWMIMIILICFLLCQPLELNVAIMVEGHCGNQNAAYSAVSGVELAIDVSMILLPLPIIWSLQLPTINKIATSSLFCLGALTIIMTGIRLQAILTVDFLDFSYSSVTIDVWTTVELGVAVMCTCGMGLRPVLDRMFSRIRTRLSNQGEDTVVKPISLHRLNPQRANGFESLSDVRDSDGQYGLAKSTRDVSAFATDEHDAESGLGSGGIHVSTEISVQSEKR